jgi:hypothetical protein
LIVQPNEALDHWLRYGVKDDEQATKAILARTSTFTADARRFLQRHIWELDGKDYLDILGWVDLV